ncbi:hypothetical protein CAEBREN_07849 [Caenorhabditis brenneri]|uniref:Uncharacterized protein n=1 Tax=Caenorhabditis brenneri TaxID=135651 RepID=G0NZA3_CAEBE|nr:hypothetical protein CAEBREN_07849 [Caenorhabditis brenneri]
MNFKIWRLVQKYPIPTVFLFRFQKVVVLKTTTTTVSSSSFLINLILLGGRVDT